MDDHLSTETDEKYKLSKKYHLPEFPVFYRKHLLSQETEEEEFISLTLHRIFQNGQIKGKRLLDVGCGPSVYRIATASRFFSEIILSEYAECNRKELKKWLENDPSSLDWSKFIKMAARFEENGNAEMGIEAIESRIRRRVKDVVPCDILNQQILAKDIGKFDVIFSAYCLECVCPTPEAFKSAIKKIASYIVQGGALVLITIIDSSHCIYVNNSEQIQFNDLSVSEKLLKEALTEANLTVKHWYYSKDIGEAPMTKCSGIVVSSAIKSDEM